MHAGIIQQLWRYPVKSMGGERIESAEVTANGIVGDRTWAVRDTTAGEIVGAKRIPALLGCTARTIGFAREDGAFEVEIALPNGERLTTRDRAAVNDALSGLCKRPVTLEPLRPADDLDFYRHGKRDADHPAPNLQQIMGLEPGDPLPDFSGLPPAIAQFATPPGTFFDAYALHIVTTASLMEATRLEPRAHFDVRRFRPNAVIETPAGLTGFCEFEWAGKRLDAGSVGIDVHAPAVRCSMVMAPQPGLDRDRLALRTLVQHTGQDFGIYCNIATPGSLSIGDTVTLS
jgi:uncharacterized protein YcbX